MVKGRKAQEGRSHCGEGADRRMEQFPKPQCTEAFSGSAEDEAHRLGLLRPQNRTSWVWISLISSSSHPRLTLSDSELWVFSFLKIGLIISCGYEDHPLQST